MRSRSFSGLPLIGLLAIAYFIAGKLGLMLASLHASASPVWPPAGIALAAMLLFGYRVWPAIFVGAFLVNLTTAGNVATSLAIAPAILIGQRARVVDLDGALLLARDRPDGLRYEESLVHPAMPALWG